MSELKPKLFAALDKIGKTNGHNVPDSQDTVTACLHEYHVATLAESYFKKRREVAKKVLEKQLTAPQIKKIEKAVSSVVDTQIGLPVEIIQSEHYNLQIELKNGATFVDMQKLKVELATKHKMKMIEV